MATDLSEAKAPNRLRWLCATISSVRCYNPSAHRRSNEVYHTACLHNGPHKMLVHQALKFIARLRWVFFLFQFDLLRRPLLVQQRTLILMLHCVAVRTKYRLITQTSAQAVNPRLVRQQHILTARLRTGIRESQRPILLSLGNSDGTPTSP